VPRESQFGADCPRTTLSVPLGLRLNFLSALELHRVLRQRRVRDIQHKGIRWPSEEQHVTPRKSPKVSEFGHEIGTEVPIAFLINTPAVVWLDDAITDEIVKRFHDRLVIKVDVGVLGNVASWLLSEATPSQAVLNSSSPPQHKSRQQGI